MPRATGSRRRWHGPRRVPLDDTCLVVIGRGTSDSDANGNIAKVARMLWEGMGFAHAEIGYSGVAHPAHGNSAGAGGGAGLPPARRLPLLPVHRRAGQTDLRGDGCRGRPASGDRVPEGTLSRRPQPRGGELRRAHPRDRRRRQSDELLLVQVSGADPRPRARSGRGHKRRTTIMSRGSAAGTTTTMLIITMMGMSMVRTGTIITMSTSRATSTEAAEAPWLTAICAVRRRSTPARSSSPGS